MKKLLIALFAISLLLAPVGLVAQDDPAPVAVEEVAPPAPEAPTEEPAVEPEPAAEPEEESEPVKIPWMVTFFWPMIVTALIGVVKALSVKAKEVIPPQLWPIANMVLVAVATGLQQSGSPQEAVMNILAAVLIAFGFVKTIDFGKGKWSTVKPSLKKQMAEAIAAGKIK